MVGSQFAWMWRRWRRWRKLANASTTRLRWCRMWLSLQHSRQLLPPFVGNSVQPGGQRGGLHRIKFKCSVVPWSCSSSAALPQPSNTEQRNDGGLLDLELGADVRATRCGFHGGIQRLGERFKSKGRVDVAAHCCRWGYLFCVGWRQ